jgi:rhodanese-related sulfurtransferase/uncharacterized damage-inducible protein DinB
MKRYLALLAIALCAAAPMAMAKEAKPAAAPAAAEKSDIRAEFARNLDSAGDKLVQLAEAVPADKYTWRPGEGVRSFAEVFLHAAAGNYFLTTFIGAKAPEGFDPKTFETSTTQKDAIIDHLKKSLAHAKAVAAGLSDADLETKAKWFLGESTKREILFFAASHNHEHLGQLIGYARMNGIVPPWSQSEKSEKKETRTGLAPEEAWKAIRAGALLVDVRSPAEYAQGHLEGAMLLPHDQIASRASELGSDKDRQIVLYCRTGNRSKQAKESLEKLGYTHVMNAGAYESLKQTQ